MAAMSLALWTLLAGPRRTARVLEIDAGAVYLRIDPLAGADSRDGRDYPGTVVALLEPEAVRLPIGIVLPPSDLVPVSVAGALASRGEIQIGWGAITVADTRFSVLDWWNPGVPELARPAQSITGEEPSGRSAADRAPDEPVFEAPELLAGGLAALASGAVESAVEQLIGVGGGLIPPGDDVLVGALVALAAWAPGSPARQALATATATGAERTTPVSVALLQSAATGFTTPEVIDYLTALSPPGGDVDQALARLVGVEIGSGTAISLGIRSQLRSLHNGSPHSVG